MTTARDNILARVRKALGKSPDRAADVGAAQRYIAEHRQGPRPTMPADLAKQFMQRATDMASTVEALAARDEVPSAVARYLAGLHSYRLARQQLTHAAKRRSLSRTPEIAQVAMERRNIERSCLRYQA